MKKKILGNISSFSRKVFLYLVIIQQYSTPPSLNSKNTGDTSKNPNSLWASSQNRKLFKCPDTFAGI